MGDASSTSLVAIMPGPTAPGDRGGDCELREIPLPDLEPDSALLRVEYSEVCGTDVHLRDGRLAGVPYPIIPGHVSVGVLEKVRGRFLDVDGHPFAEGDRVTFLDVHKTCHACWACLVAKATTRCPARKVYGITYGLADGLTGGWSQYVYLKPGVRAIRMDHVESKTFIAGGCSMPTAMHAVELGEIALADTVLVLGSGPVGLSAIAFSALRGAARVFCIGAPAERLETARAMGANASFNFEGKSETERINWVLQNTSGRGADLTIECTGAPAAVIHAMRMTRDAGRVVVVGQYADHGEIALNPHLDLNKKHLSVRGCWGSDYSHFHRTVAMLRNKRAAGFWSHVPVERFSLSGVNDALAAVEAGKVVKAIVVPWQ